MPIRLTSHSADFAERFNAFLATKREVSADVENAVRAIVDDVRASGDAAVIDGVLIDGSASLVQRTALTVRRLQSGYLYHYAFAMILGLILVSPPLLDSWTRGAGRPDGHRDVRGARRRQQGGRREAHREQGLSRRRDHLRIPATA